MGPLRTTAEGCDRDPSTPGGKRGAFRRVPYVQQIAHSSTEGQGAGLPAGEVGGSQGGSKEHTGEQEASEDCKWGKRKGLREPGKNHRGGRERGRQEREKGAKRPRKRVLGPKRRLRRKVTGGGDMGGGTWGRKERGSLLRPASKGTYTVSGSTRHPRAPLASSGTPSAGRSRRYEE